MAIPFDTKLFIWILVGILTPAVILGIIQNIYLVKILNYLRSKHSKIFEKYFPGPKFFKTNILFINQFLLFTNKLNLDKTLNKNIKKYRLIMFLEFIDLLILIVFLLFFFL